MQLYKEAGVPGSTFTGVPIFQAQGLTVKTENSRYTPLFLAKEDLDEAVGAAFSQREAAKEVANKSKASAAEEDVASARATVSAPSARPTDSCIKQSPCDVALRRRYRLSSASDGQGRSASEVWQIPTRAVQSMFSCALQLDAASKGRQRKAAAAELDRAEARLAKYQHRISTGQSGDGLPKVRCLAVLVAAATRMSLQPHEWRCCKALEKGLKAAGALENAGSRLLMRKKLRLQISLEFGVLPHVSSHFPGQQRWG